MTPAGLSVSGWSYRVGHAGESVVPLAGTRVRGSDLRGVVCRLAHVDERDLPHIASEHREYVAAEMHAFLLSWLTELDCPVVNRPSASTLNGPAWRPEQWVAAAAAQGIGVRPTYRRHALDGDPANGSGQGSADRFLAGTSTRVVEVVGQQVLGHEGAGLRTPARQLADAAGLAAMTAMFDVSVPRPLLVWATAWVDVRKGQVADALLSILGGPRRRRRRTARLAR